MNLFSASAAVAAAVADQLHRALCAIIDVMRHIQPLFRDRKAPAVNKIKVHLSALIIHPGLQCLTGLQPFAFQYVLLSVFNKNSTGLYEAKCYIT